MPIPKSLLAHFPLLFYAAAAAPLISVPAAAGAPCVLPGLLHHPEISTGPVLSPKPKRTSAFRAINGPFLIADHRFQSRTAQRTFIKTFFYFGHDFFRSSQSVI